MKATLLSEIGLVGLRLFDNKEERALEAHSSGEAHAQYHF